MAHQVRGGDKGEPRGKRGMWVGRCGGEGGRRGGEGEKREVRRWGISEEGGEEILG